METIWLCRYCKVEADTKKQIIKHENNKHGHKCKECDYVHTDILTFQRHMEFAHNQLPVNQCKMCHKKFLGNDEFDKHLQFTHGTNHWDLNLALKQSLRDLRKIDDNLKFR